MDSKFQALLSIEELLKSISKVENYKKFCSEQVGKMDSRRVDYDHCLETVTMDCVKLAQLSKMRKTDLITRRFYKDEIEYINAFEACGVDTQAIVNGLKKLKSAYENTQKRLDNRQYTPRCLYELFGISTDEASELEERKKDKYILGKSANNNSLRIESKFRQISGKN